MTVQGYGNYGNEALPVTVQSLLVVDDDELTRAIDIAAPGAEIIVANGSYLGDRVIRRAADPGLPFLLRAQTELTSGFTGDVVLAADGWVLQGLDFVGEGTDRPRVSALGSYQRLTQCRLRGGSTQRTLLSVAGEAAQRNVRVDRNELYAYPCHAIHVTGSMGKTVVVDHNFVHDGGGVTINDEPGAAILYGDDATRHIGFGWCAFNLVRDHAGSDVIRCLASRLVLYKNTLLRGNVTALVAGIALLGGEGVVLAGNWLEGGLWLSLRGLGHQVLGNLVRGADVSAYLMGGNYDPRIYPLIAPASSDLGAAPLAACVESLLVSNRFDGRVDVGTHGDAEMVRPTPAALNKLLAHEGPAAPVSLLTGWENGTLISLLGSPPPGFLVPAATQVQDADVGPFGVGQGDQIMTSVYRDLLDWTPVSPDTWTLVPNDDSSASSPS